MLDPWIIEEILRREEEQKRREQERRPEMPLESPRREREPAVAPPTKDREERGVVVIDI